MPKVKQDSAVILLLDKAAGSVLGYVNGSRDSEERYRAMNKYDLAAIIGTSEYDNGEWHKIPAAVQRSMFGYVPFGKKSVRFTFDATYGYCINIGYNTLMHWNVGMYTYDQAAQKMQNGEKFE